MYLKQTKSGEAIYTSDQLARLWGFGYASVGDVTFGSAAYVARYHLKKAGAGNLVTDDHYTNKLTGEMLHPEYVSMSKKPGLGRGWFDRYKSDVFPRDARVIKGVDTKPCKFYDSLYEVENPDGFKSVKLARARRADPADNTESRLLVKEQVKKAQIATLSTSLEEIYS